MAGYIPDIGREGNRLEYLAHYILSKLGAASPVPRPEDIGVDFYCTLGQDNPHGITVTTSFAVQLKSSKDRIFTLGGNTKGGTWKRYEIDWFLNLELPLLLGVPDAGKKRLDLYATSIARFMTRADKLPFEVSFQANDIYDSTADLHPPDQGTPSRVTTMSADCDGMNWSYDLGPPIVSCSIDDLDDQSKVQQFRVRLKDVLETERLNAVYHALGLPYWTWVLRCKTNESHQLAFAYDIKKSGPRRDNILKTMVPFVAALGISYKNEGEITKLQELQAFASKLPKTWVPDEVKTPAGGIFTDSGLFAGGSSTTPFVTGGQK